MTVTDTGAPPVPAWWTQSVSPSGEADPMTPPESAETTADLGFADLVDVLNPLHHIPIIGNLYRTLTGDSISETARMAGGTFWAGPVGLVGALADVISERETGQDIAGTAGAWLTDESPTDDATNAVMLADAGPTDAKAADTATQTSPTADLPVVPHQAFAGSKADRLDAFIRQANAVRSPLDPPERAAPVRLAGSNGGGDVAQWMMRALDKYESMRASGQS